MNSKTQSALLQPLEPRQLFAFGDIDPTWGKNGSVADRIGTDDQLLNMAIQPDGSLISQVYSYNSNRPFRINGEAANSALIVNRRLANGKIDRVFGGTGNIALSSMDSSYVSQYDSMFAVLSDGSIISTVQNSPDNVDSSVDTTIYYLNKSGFRIPANGLSTLARWNQINPTPDGQLVVLSHYYERPINTSDWTYQSQIATWNLSGSTTQLTQTPPKSSFEVGTSLNSAFALDNGSILFQKSNRLYLRTSANQEIKFGNKPYTFTPFKNDYGFSHVFLQGKYAVLVQGNTICRFNLASGSLDTTFARGNPDAKNGMLRFPYQLNDIKLLDDGSLVYTTNNPDETSFDEYHVYVGHMNRNGLPDLSMNTDLGGYARRYDIDGYAQHLTVGINGQIYVSAITDGRNQILRFTMPNYKTGTISGYTFNDANQNKSLDAVEKKLAGRLIYIDENNNNVLDDFEWQSVTDKNGKYAFVGATAGKYRVREVVPRGYKLTNTVFSSGKITLAAGQTLPTNIGTVKS